MNHRQISILFLFIVTLPAVLAWYPYGNNIFQNQVQQTAGGWTNESYSSMSTVTNLGLDTDFQPLVDDVDDDGAQEIVMADGNFIKIVSLENLTVEAELNVGIVAGQPTMENVDADAELEIVVVSTKNNEPSLYIIGWDNSALSSFRENLTSIFGTGSQSQQGASPKCWYGETGNWGANTGYCFWRTYNDTYVKYNINTQTASTYNFAVNSSYEGINNSNATIPILANIDSDGSVIPEFFIIRAYQLSQNAFDLVMMDADTWTPSSVFDGGNSYPIGSGSVITHKIANGLMRMSGTFGGNLGNDKILDQTIANPILYDAGDGGGYEILLSMKSFYAHVSGVSCTQYEALITTLDENGNIEWSVSYGLPCTYAVPETTYYYANSPLVADFVSGHSGNEVCWANAEGLVPINFTSFTCVDTSGSSIYQNKFIEFRDVYDCILDGTYATYTADRDSAYAVDLTGDGQYEYINGIFVYDNAHEDGNESAVATCLDFGLGRDNSKSPQPIVDSNGAVQLLYSDDTGNDISGTKLFTIGGSAPAGENQMPAISSVTATPTSRVVAIGQPVQFVIAGSDPEGDPLYTAKRCSAVDSATSFSYTNTQTCTYGSAGSYNARLYLSDSEHLTTYTEYQDLNINVTTSSIYCGDGSCSGNETATTCPEDCSVGSTGATEDYHVSLQTDLVNVNADPFDASQQGLLGNMFLGILEFFSRTAVPLFALFVFVLLFMIVFLIMKKIQNGL